MENVNEKVNVVVTKSPKSMGVSLLLTFLFGPFGMMYSTILGGIIMLVINIVVGIITLGLGLLLTWPIMLIWAGVATKTYNNKLMNGNI